MKQTTFKIKTERKHKMNEKNSNSIADFLKFLRDTQMEYNIVTQTEYEADRETQDLLHRLELENDSYHDMAKLAKAMKTVRCKRREAKDAKIVIEPIIQWLTENDKFIKSLERLLGEVRKAEKSTTNRHYIDKTDILKEVLKQREL